MADGPDHLNSSRYSTICLACRNIKWLLRLYGNLSTEPPRKQHDFEKEYERECGWHDIIFGEDEIRREWLPAGRAALPDSKLELPLERPFEAESVKPMSATTEELPTALPARSVSVKARRQAQATKRKARRKAEKSSRIAAAAAWAKDKPNLINAEVREKPPSKVDLYTECTAAVPNLTYNEFKAGLKIERSKARRGESSRPKIVTHLFAGLYRPVLHTFWPTAKRCAEAKYRCGAAVSRNHAGAKVHLLSASNPNVLRTKASNANA